LVAGQVVPVGKLGGRFVAAIPFFGGVEEKQHALFRNHSKAGEVGLFG